MSSDCSDGRGIGRRERRFGQGNEAQHRRLSEFGPKLRREQHPDVDGV